MKSRKAFTLIELLVVLAVMGLMMGVIGFSLLSGGGAELGSSQRNLLGILQKARTKAAATGLATRVIIHAQTDDEEKFHQYLDEYDLLIIPGGVKALEKLRQEQSALDFVSSWDSRGKTIGSICHGGQMLISSGIAKGRDVSGYYSIKDDLINAGGNFVDDEDVVSDNLICCPHYKWMGQWMNKVIERNNAV